MVVILDNLIQTIFLIYGGPTVVVCGLTAFLGKRYLDHVREKDRGEVYAELESLKNDLGKLALEHQVKFTNIYQRRAEIIAELYGLIYDTERIFTQYIANIGPKDNLYKGYELIIKVREFIEKNRIYFSESLNKIIDDNFKIFNDAVNFISFKEVVDNPEASERDIEYAKTHAKIGVKELPVLRQELIKAFRELLGTDQL